MSATKTNEVGHPALRFPGFDNEWKATTFGDVADYTKGFAFKSADYRRSGVRIIRVSDLAARRIKKDNDNVHIEESRQEEFAKWKIRKNEIVVTTVGSRPDLIESAVGRGIFVDSDDEGLLNQNMLKLESKNGNEPRFIFSQINTPRYTDYVSQIKRGNANQANITVKDLMAYRIAVSSLPEQRKIADFLTAVDGRIGQLIQKRALLEDYKKGVMQQLFTQAIRFQDDHGNDFPDWEEKKLGEVGSVIGGGTPDSTNEAYWNGDVQWFTPTEIRSKFVSRSKRTISQSGLKKCSASMLPVGTLLFTSRATIAEVGIATEPCTTNQGFQSIVVNPGTSNEFVYHWVIHFKKDFLRKAQGSTFLEIGGKEVRKMPMLIPSLPEQTKIADFLSAIDRKIESVATQITETQTFKRGLLQQMFV